MAESFTRWVLTISLIDGAKRDCGNSYYVGETDANDYNAAADDAARALTNIGIFIARYLTMTQANYVKAQVGKLILANPAPAYPALTVLRGNKLQFKNVAGGKNGFFNLPARSASAFTQTSGLDVSITTPLAMTNFVSAYDSTILNWDGDAELIRAAKVVD